MRIKIISVSHPNIWYRNKIGYEYEVDNIGKKLYQLKSNHFYKLFREDCEVINVDEEDTV